MQTKKGNLTIRIEPQLKEEASTLFRSLGLDLSTATGIFHRQALRCHGLPFEVKLDEPNEIRQWMTQKTAETCMAHTTA